MNKFILQIILILLTHNSFAQIIKLQTGVSATQFNWDSWPATYKPLNEVTTNGYVYLGVDYLNKKYLNLSSNIGYLTKSDKGVIYVPCGANSACRYASSTVLHYLSINTTLDLNYPTRIGIIPFLTFGPRVDFLTSNSSNVSSYFYNNSSEVNSILYGLIFGFGVKYKVSRIQIELSADFLMNINSTSDLMLQYSSEVYKISETTQLYGLTFGYELR